MEMPKTEPENPALRQWHPAFYAGAQIELQEDADNLIFENEHHYAGKQNTISGGERYVM